MVEIFKTNVKQPKEANRLIALLTSHLIKHIINFDLEDCDCILRIENRNGEIRVPTIKSILSGEGYCCEILTD